MVAGAISVVFTVRIGTSSTFLATRFSIVALTRRAATVVHRIKDTAIKTAQSTNPTTNPTANVPSSCISKV